MPLSRNTLEATLNALAQQTAAEEWGRREWTRQVKIALIQLGIERHYTPYPNPQRCEGEWLYDVIWVRMNEQDRVMSTPLVAEIEWGDPGEVWDDFQKLLVARSGVRVMIFDDYADLLAELQAHVHQYKHGGDRYLLARYTAQNNFHVIEA